MQIFISESENTPISAHDVSCKRNSGRELCQELCYVKLLPLVKASPSLTDGSDG